MHSVLDLQIDGERGLWHVTNGRTMRRDHEAVDVGRASAVDEGSHTHTSASVLQTSFKHRWTSCTAMAPSPTADATRLTEPERTSPAARMPGRLVSSV